MKKPYLFLTLAACLLTACSSGTAEESPSPETSPESTAVVAEETVAEETAVPESPYDSEELRAILDKREALTTLEEVHAWREELNAYWTQFEQDNFEEPPAPEVPSEPVILPAEFYAGEFSSGHEGDFNDNITIELEVSVEVSRTVCRPGDTVNLVPEITNIGATFMYLPGYGIPSASLRHREYVNGSDYDDGYADYTLHQGPVPFPEDIPMETLCETGDSWSNGVTIRIPENALPGMYDVWVSSHGCTWVAEDAVEVTGG